MIQTFLTFLALRTSTWPDQSGFNSGYYSNPQVDELLEQARVSTSQTVRAALYKEMRRIVHEDAPWFFVANWKQCAKLPFRAILPLAPAQS